MKKIIKTTIFLVLTGSMMYSSLEAHGSIERPSYIKEISHLDKSSKGFTRYSYLTTTLIAPGAGLLFRTSGAIKQEFNFKVGVVPSSLSFLSPSTSIIFSRKDYEGNDLYLGFGGGGYMMLVNGIYGNRTAKILAPSTNVFVGMQNDRGFIDLGADVVFPLEGEYSIIPLPTVRVGFHF